MITNKTAREFVIAKKLFPDISTSVIETDTATGTIARFETNMTEPILEGIFAINPYQEGTGDPSPSNPRAIHGYTSMNVVRCGKNLFDPTSILKGSYNSTTNTWSNISGSQVKAFEFDFKPNTQYTFSGIETQSEANKNARLVIRYTDGTNDNLFATNDTTPQAFVKTSASGKSINFVYYGYGTSSTNGVSVQYFQIEVGTSSSDFEPYTATTYPISWQTEAGTVYGGELNATTGVLRVTKASFKISDCSAFDTQSTPTSGVWRGTLPSAVASVIKYATTDNYAIDAITVRYTAKGYTPLSSSDIGKFAITSGFSGRMVIIDNNYTSASDFLAAVGNDIVVYELATPTEVQLTPQEVRTLLGTNNIYHDCNGDSTITYKKSVPVPTTTDKRQFLPLIYGKKYYRKEY